MAFVPTISASELARTVQELIENGVISEPELPAEILADRLIEEAERTFIAELGRTLIVRDWTKKIRVARTTKRKLARPKGFENLPLRIRRHNGTSVSLVKAHYTDLRDFCKVRSREHIARKKDDPVLKEARKLRDRMRRRAKWKRGITVGEVLGLE
jgi:hypothetical protein